MKQISARLRSLAHLIPIWFTLFAAIFLAANYGSSRYLHHLDHGRQIAKERQAAAGESREEARCDLCSLRIKSYFQRVYPGKSESGNRTVDPGSSQNPGFLRTVCGVQSRVRTSARTLNIHSAGFSAWSVHCQGRGPIDKNALNLFVFGGSMALGSAVADRATPYPPNCNAVCAQGRASPSLNVYSFARRLSLLVAGKSHTCAKTYPRPNIVPNITPCLSTARTIFIFGMERHRNLHFSAGSVRIIWLAHSAP